MNYQKNTLSIDKSPKKQNSSANIRSISSKKVSNNNTRTNQDNIYQEMQVNNTKTSQRNNFQKKPEVSSNIANKSSMARNNSKSRNISTDKNTIDKINLNKYDKSRKSSTNNNQVPKLKNHGEVRNEVHDYVVENIEPISISSGRQNNFNMKNNSQDRQNMDDYLKNNYHSQNPKNENYDGQNNQQYFSSNVKNDAQINKQMSSSFGETENYPYNTNATETELELRNRIQEREIENNAYYTNNTEYELHVNNQKYDQDSNRKISDNVYSNDQLYDKNVIRHHSFSKESDIAKDKIRIINENLNNDRNFNEENANYNSRRNRNDRNSNKNIETENTNKKQTREKFNLVPAMLSREKVSRHSQRSVDKNTKGSTEKEARAKNLFFSRSQTPSKSASA